VREEQKGPESESAPLITGAALLGAGALIALVGLVGLAVGGGHLVAATRRWVKEMEVPPSELARQKWAQAKTAARPAPRPGRTARKPAQLAPPDRRQQESRTASPPAPALLADPTALSWPAAGTVPSPTRASSPGLWATPPTAWRGSPAAEQVLQALQVSQQGVVAQRRTIDAPELADLLGEGGAPPAFLASRIRSGRPEVIAVCAARARRRSCGTRRAASHMAHGGGAGRVRRDHPLDKHRHRWPCVRCQVGTYLAGRGRGQAASYGIGRGLRPSTPSTVSYSPA
jgi:hypothetical protein